MTEEKISAAICLADWPPTRGILASGKSKGKAGFRLYAPWDCPASPIAVRTQKWQLSCFVESTKARNQKAVLLNMLGMTLTKIG